MHIRKRLRELLSKIPLFIKIITLVFIFVFIMLARMGYLVVSGNHLYNINVKIKSIGNKSISIKAYRLNLRKQPIEFSGENAGHNNAVNVWLVIPDKLKAIIKNINVSVGQKSYYYRIDAFFKLWKKINYKKQIKDEIAKKKWEANNRSISKYEIYSMPEVSPGRGSILKPFSKIINYKGDSYLLKKGIIFPVFVFLLIFLFWLIKKKYESTSSSTDKIKRCFSFILKNEEAILKIIFSVVSVSYVSVLAYYYLYPALVPDEILFYNYFNQINKSIFSNFDIGIIFENRFGYGSFYWLFGGVFNNIIILRIFALLYMLSVPVFLYLIGKRLRASLKMILLTIMLWFSFPSAFWFGKLIGPELMSIFYGLLGVYLTMRHRKSGLFFLAFSAGIKLNCIVFVFFALFFHFYKKNYEKTFKIRNIILFSAAGFLAANLVILINPSHFFKSIFGSTSSFSFKTLTSLQIYYNKNWLWDIVYSGGLLNLSVHYISFSFILYALFTLKAGNKKILITITFSLLFSILLLSRSSFIGWYWYPFIVLLPILLFYFNLEKKRVFVFVYVLIVANFILNLPLIEERIYLKNKQIEVYKNKTAIINYLKAKIKNKNYKIYNYMEYGFTYNGKSDYLNTYLKLKKLALQTPAYIIIGERLTAKRSWLKIENLCFNLRYKNYNVEYLGNFKTVHLIKITKNALTN